VIPPVQDDQVDIAALTPRFYKYVQAKDVGKLTPTMLLNMLRFALILCSPTYFVRSIS
jgi:hypothetical protein